MRLAGRRRPDEIELVKRLGDGAAQDVGLNEGVAAVTRLAPEIDARTVT